MSGSLLWINLIICYHPPCAKVLVSNHHFNTCNVKVHPVANLPKTWSFKVERMDGKVFNIVNVCTHGLESILER